MTEPARPPLRSLLFVPGDSERKLEKCLASGAACLILDIEDSVVLAAKAKARELVFQFLGKIAPRTPRPQVFVRVNGLDSGLIEADLDAVMDAAPDGIVLPKCSGGAALQHLGAMLAVKEAEHDLADGSTRILPIATETAASIFQMGTYAGASRRLVGLTWGAEDLSAAIGAEVNRGANGAYTAPYALARSLTLFAAAAAEVPAIDTVHLGLRDLSALRLECEDARRDGFAGKLAIHPDQVAIINSVFSPSPDEIARAQAIIAAFAAAPATGVVSFEGQMLDRPHLVRARRILGLRPDRG